MESTLNTKLLLQSVLSYLPVYTDAGLPLTDWTVGIWGHGVDIASDLLLPSVGLCSLLT